MNPLEFFGSVWVSIAVGLFILFMVVGCSFDRSDNESFKWWAFVVGSIVLFLTFIFTKNETTSIKDIARSSINWFVIYLVIGLVYSVLEFFVAVRKSSRYWKRAYEEYKLDASRYLGKSNHSTDHLIPSVEHFVEVRIRYTNEDAYHKRFIQVKSAWSENKDVGTFEPTIHRGELAEAVGCWTFFWPFYAVSLILGDLLLEFFRAVAEILVNLSGGLVRLAFKDVFK